MTFGDESRTLDLASMPIREAAECERLTGWTWTEWRTHLAEDRANAVAFAWWLAGRRAGLDVGKFTDVDLDLAKLRWAVELSDEEQAQVDAAEEAADDEDPDLPTGPAEAETLTD
jgi:hypothetical protein